MSEINPVYLLVKDVHHTFDMEEVVALLSSGDWIAIAATSSKDGNLFVLGRTR